MLLELLLTTSLETFHGMGIHIKDIPNDILIKQMKVSLTVGQSSKILLTGVSLVFLGHSPNLSNQSYLRKGVNSLSV